MIRTRNSIITTAAVQSGDRYSICYGNVETYVSSVYLLFMPSLDLCCKHHLGIRIFQPFDDNNTIFHTARTLDKATFKIDTDRPVLLDL